jgi:hypothetical protein
MRNSGKSSIGKELLFEQHPSQGSPTKVIKEQQHEHQVTPAIYSLQPHVTQERQAQGAVRAALILQAPPAINVTMFTDAGDDVHMGHSDIGSNAVTCLLCHTAIQTQQAITSNGCHIPTPLSPIVERSPHGASVVQQTPQYWCDVPT